MRFFRFLLLLLTATGWLRAQEAVPTKRESVSFDGVVLIIKSSQDNPREQIKEFLPVGENFESWTKLASIRDYPKHTDPRVMAENLVRVLKKQNPGAQSAIIQNPKNGDIIVDFVTWPADQSFVEFNIFKYSKKEGGGVLAQQYALREYKDTEGFLRSLKPERMRLVNLMANGGLIGRQ